MRALLALPAVVLFHCPVPEEAYADKITVAACEWILDCYPGTFPSVEACVDSAEITDMSSCRYDGAAARDCLDAWRALDTCDVVDVPACGHVYYDCTEP